jgi:uncharacterized Tic20 family protein
MNDPYTPPIAPPPSPPPVPANNWRLYTELSSLAMFVFPLGNIVGPLVLWLIKKDTLPEADEAGKKVLNFNLSWTIWIIVSCGLGIIPWIIIDIIAILKAANNERFEHPLTIQFLK